MVDVETLKLQDAGLAGRVALMLNAPAQMLLPERLLLYATVRGLRPARCLEIGTHTGGSSVITVAALDDVGGGTLVCVDPYPVVAADVWSTIAHRATMIAGPSPAALTEALAIAGGYFDFIFVDGDHTHDGVVRDVEGVLDVAAPGAHVLFHDSHYWEVSEALDACAVRFAGRVVDVGTLSTMSTPPSVGRDGRTERWGGLRMFRVTDAPSASLAKD